MNQDKFGNLREWGLVLERLDDLKQSRKLDEHQKGLTRILRYQENWRLREKVLEHANEIESPTDELLAEMFNIMTEENAHFAARILATKALGYLISKRKVSPEKAEKFNKDKAVLQMIDFLDSTEPPYFHAAIAKSLGMIGDKRALPVLTKMYKSAMNVSLKECVDEAISKIG